MTPFILASSSPRRRDLLASLGIPFEIAHPDIDETQRPGETPLAYVQRLSQQKAAQVAAHCSTPAYILAADTIVVHEGEILGKPQDAAEARLMLRRLRGQTHRVCTAITLITPGKPPLTEMTCTDVQMRAYGDDEIEAYIATGDPFDKAGAYAIQHPGFAPVAHISGSHSNVVGLPLETLRQMLAQVGWPLEEQT
jgi:septum formation protein